MSSKTELATVAGSKSPKGWDVSIDVESVVKSLCTPEERAALLEKIACTASAKAVRIRQNINANGG
jgi:hypothetical protein